MQTVILHFPLYGCKIGRYRVFENNVLKNDMECGILITVPIFVCDNCSSVVFHHPQIFLVMFAFIFLYVLFYVLLLIVFPFFFTL
jgi:hypothetical protein